MDNADLYHKNSYLQRQLVFESFKKYLSKFQWNKKSRIIDLGCGEGTTISTLQKYFPNDSSLIGCDISENMIKFANEHYSNENTSFIVMDIAGDLPKNFLVNFSHIFSFYALQWVKNFRKAYNNIFTMLEPGGECFLIFPTTVSIFDVYRSLARNKKWSTWVYDVDRYITFYHDSKDPKADVKKIMQNIGFDIKVMEHKDILYVFKDMEDMRKTLSAINPFKIPNEKYDEFWEDYLNMWKKFEGLEKKPDGYFYKDIKFTYKGLIIHARKTENVEKLNP